MSTSCSVQPLRNIEMLRHGYRPRLTSPHSSIRTRFSAFDTVPAEGLVGLGTKTQHSENPATVTSQRTS